MAQESVSELEPGPELDAHVAEILGCDVDDSGPYMLCTCSPAEHSGPEGTLLGYSRVHEAAARIKEYLRDQDIQFSIHWPMGRNHVLVGDSILEVHAESEPLALCRFLARLDNERVLNHD